MAVDFLSIYARCRHYIIACKNMLSVFIVKLFMWSWKFWPGSLRVDVKCNMNTS